MSNIQSPKPFGSYGGNRLSSINDGIQLDVFSSSDFYLESLLRATNFTIGGSSNVNLDVEAELKKAEYTAGDFNIRIKFLRNVLGSSDGFKVAIQDISTDRLEVRVVPVTQPTNNADLTQQELLTAIDAFQSWFKTGFFELEKQATLSNLYLFNTPTEQVGVFDYVQDRITFDTEPYSIIFRLTTPLPTSVTVDSIVWFAQEVGTTIEEKVKVIPEELGKKITKIKGPNFNALVNKNITKSTEYKDWDDLLGATNQSRLKTTLFSGSFIEGIPLNINHQKFENFIHFSSAEERIKNFDYKVRLIQYYESIVSNLSTGLTGLPSSSVTGSAIFTSQSSAYREKKEALIGTFDSFERYMYFESSSFVSNSFGEFLDVAWPKSNTTKPYTLYNYTSSQVTDWLTKITATASLYDQNNNNTLTKLIPAHIRESEGNDNVETLVNLFGHYYDILYSYIKQYNNIYNRDESLTEGFAKDLVYHIGQNLGIDFNNGNSLQELWSYTLGLDSSGSYDNTLAISGEDRTKEIWKRIINNLPYLLRTKGTARGIKALISCFGIPQTIIRIREYGGPEPAFDTKTVDEYEKFYYTLQVGVPSGSTGISRIKTAWPTESRAIELRFKPEQNYKTEQVLFEIPSKFKCVLNYNNQLDTVGFFVSGSPGLSGSYTTASLYDDTFSHLVVNATKNTATNITYNLWLKKTKDGKITKTYTASFTTTTAQYTGSWFNPGSFLWLPGSGSSNYFSGSVQELRFWNEALHESTINNHALAPTSFQGNTDQVLTGSTSSFDTLLTRFTLGTDNSKRNYQSGSFVTQSGQQPDQTNPTSASFYSFFGPTKDYKDLVETFYLEWVDSGANRQLANKVRIDEITNPTEDFQLFTDTKVQKPASDSYPTDSPRLGVYLSLTNEINRDIAEQFGGLSLDDYIGNPADTYNQSYDSLEDLRRLYLQKYTRRSDVQSYIRVINYYDNSLFNLIKSFTPERADLQSGLLIESDMLYRNKFPVAKPSVEDEDYETTLVLPENYVIGGSVQDMDGSDKEHTNYVFDTEIVEKIVEPQGTYYKQVEGVIGGGVSEYITIQGRQNEYNNQQVAEQAASLEGLYSRIDLGVSSYGRDTRVQGSQYRFLTWAPYWTGVYGVSLYGTGSYVTTDPNQYIIIDSIGEDYYNPIQPLITGSRLSENYKTTDWPYNGEDMLWGSGSFPTANDIWFTGSYQGNRYAATYGFTFVTASTSDFWYVDQATQTLKLKETTAGTASFQIPLMVSGSTKYTVSLKLSSSLGGYNASSGSYVNVRFGSSTSSISSGFSLVDNTTGIVTITSTNYADGPYLYVEVNQQKNGTYGELSFDNLVVTQTQLAATIQDYHVGEFASTGMKNARYDGCKLTSTDYNIDSNDTIDKGPVIVVLETDSNELVVKPTKKGIFGVQETQ